MISSTYVCYFVCFVFPICTRSFDDFFSSSSSSSFSSSSSSSGGQIHRNTETAIENGKEVRYCSYKGLKFLPGATFTDYEDCHKCECTEEWFSCYTKEASFNSRSQTNGNQAECVAVKIGCETEWVLKANHSLNCDEGGLTTGAAENITTQPEVNLTTDSEANSMFGSEMNTTTGPEMNTTNSTQENATPLPEESSTEDVFSSSWF